VLTEIEARVLGCLLEKERTTPDQYPLTLNALVTACNQSTSRDPVMSLAEHQVQSTLNDLKAAGVVRMVHPSHGRSVTRYRQVFDEQLGLEPAATALLAVLLLRGPQTASELRSRTERLHGFESLAAVEQALADAVTAGHVQVLPRAPGQKEQRWQQLVADEAVHEFVAASGAGSTPRAGSEHEWRARIAELEARVAALETALADLL
jgi:uncharacterized protein YceH (UPF0502 family)